MKWSEKKNPFKVGDRVICIYPCCKEDPYSYVNGRVFSVDGEGVRIVPDNSEVLEEYVHWRLCKKIKQKEKKYKVTVEDLREAIKAGYGMWSNFMIPTDGDHFNAFLKELGIEE